MTDLGVEVVSRKNGLGYLFMVQVLSSRDQIWFGLVCFLPRRVAPSATADPRGLAPSTMSRDIVMSRYQYRQQRACLRQSTAQ